MIATFLNPFRWKPVLLIAALTGFSIVSILGAWGFQYIGEMAPCKLCFYQRYPHWAAAVLGLIILSTGARMLAWLAGLAALTTSAIGFYHSGVERKLWPGPASCSGGGGIQRMSTEDLMAQIMAAPIVRCDEIPWEMFGVTMANLNALGSLVVAVLWFHVARTRS